MISGKVAVVIGGAQGCGKACCEALVKENVKLCFGDILVDEGNALAKRLNQTKLETSAVFRKCDVTSEADIEGLFQLAKDTFGKTAEIVFNIAGVVDEFQWSKTLDLNIGGNIRCIDAALKHMSKEKGGPGGVYVAMASCSGMRPEPWGPVYSAVKHAVIGLCRSWGSPEHFNIHRVRVNCVCPTTIDTEFTRQISRGYFYEENVARLAEQDKLRPSEVADGFMKAVKEESLNGQAIRVTRALGIDLAPFADPPAQ